MSRRARKPPVDLSETLAGVPVADLEREPVVEAPAPAFVPAAGERAPDFLWNGRPVYRCRICQRYERIENLAAVERHEVEAHTKAPEVRESRIVGLDGQPLQIAGVKGEGNV
jgi:hypothetical protein